MFIFVFCILQMFFNVGYVCELNYVVFQLLESVYYWIYLLSGILIDKVFEIYGGVDLDELILIVMIFVLLWR